MPVTKTAKRALRSSVNKQEVNKLISSRLDIAIRKAKSGSKKSIKEAISLTDRAKKKKLIHANKAARLKSTLSKLSPSVTKK